MTAIRRCVRYALVGVTIAAAPALSQAAPPVAAPSVAAPSAGAPDLGADSLAVLALADSALAAITRGDPVALTDLMIPEAHIIAASLRGGGPGYRLRTRDQERARAFSGTIVERGYAGSARVAGLIATVWLPYDIYVNGAWSHCGVDLFTFVRGREGWRIASLVYSVEQPPACAPHPAGPPR